MIKTIRDRMIKAAKAKDIIYYSEIGDLMNLSMDNPNHRDELAHILGEISTTEHHEGRPLLSAVVVHKENHRPGKVFFQLAKDLKKQKRGEDDEIFYATELQRVYKEWF